MPGPRSVGALVGAVALVGVVAVALVGPVVPLAWNYRTMVAQRGTTTQPGSGINGIATISSPSDRPEMGYIARMRFAPGELSVLAETEEIEIETALPGGPNHRTIIWVVVDGDDAFVRSYKGATARWYREVVANPRITIHAPGLELHAQAVAAVDPASIRRTSDALARKYAGRDGTEPMLLPEVLDTTLRLTPG